MIREHSITMMDEDKEYVIEVTVRVDGVYYQRGSYSYYAESDSDFYGYFDVEYTIENVRWSNEDSVEFDNNPEDCPFRLDGGTLYDKLCEKVWDDMNNPDD